MGALLRYAWPGNVRELRNVVDASAVLAHGEFIEVGDLPEEVRGSSVDAPTVLPVRHTGDFGGGAHDPALADRTLLRILAELQRLSDRIDDLAARIDESTDPVSRGVGRFDPVERAEDLRWQEAQDAEFDPVVSEMPGDLASAEKAMIAAALRQNDGNRKRAAEQLGIAERTLYRKLRRYGLS
jgi:DNA-binding NtrC family response regulator